ncbi:sensor histidine kinase [Chitinophaga sp. sic0106]|uniref:sensor histidine kinase n=1 Tax=Chitinophaga sp. sic0106 TaxID=2854785 RepID=UPI001C483F53|nr:histidine kinase [Chitinophaga sp. sic0106]MBV7530316.1 histidine kinase [Chitinophaga sp. sic0106]
MAIVLGMNLFTLSVYSRESLTTVAVRDGLFGLVNFFQFYIFFRWIVPSFLHSRNWQLLLLRVFPVVTAFNSFKYLLAAEVFPKIVLYQGYRYDLINKRRVELFTTFGAYFTNTLWTSLVLLAAAFALHLFLHWLREDKRRALLQQQQQKAESGFLKMQLNSHFLINSLNSIYSLAITGSPEVVPANNTLVHLLCYMLDQPDDIDFRSPIHDEVQYLRDFISLQQLRTGIKDGIRADFGDTLPDKQIAPMLLVAFVENAFKHGITNQPANPVTIKLEGDEQALSFMVGNKKSIYNKDKTGGIGLENVRKRLQLIYPQKHDLQITDTENNYQCHLKIYW